MPWKAVHPANTMWERVPDVDGAPVFEFGFWPPLEAERFHALIKTSIDAATLTGEALERAVADQHENANRLVAFGVRNWRDFMIDGSPIPCATEEVEVDGERFKRLTKESLALIYANHLRGPLMIKCHLFNTLSEDQKKTSGLRSPSVASKTLTDVIGASPEALQRSEKSSDSKEGSSTAARSS